MNSQAKFLFLAVSLLLAPVVSAEPYLPTDSNEVIEAVPEALRGESGKEFAALRAKVDAEPGNRDAAVLFVRKCIEQGRRLSDPRYFGYAEAVLESRLKSASADPELLILRAMILERRHDFAAAKADLLRVVEDLPNSGQAWATLAGVQTVTGDLTAAKESCLKLAALVTPIASISCLSLVGSLTGTAEKSYEVLSSALVSQKSAGAVTPGEELWSLSILSEIAERLGKKAEAEGYYKKALQLDPNDAFTLSAYSDFLLTEKRAAEVKTMLAGKLSNDPLLLRLVIAEKQLNDADLPSHRKLLKSHLDAEIARGEGVHLRERAMFELFVDENAVSALESASENWESQKEAPDLLLLARSAVAAKNAGAMKKVEDWLTSTKWEDARVRELLGGEKK